MGLPWPGPLSRLFLSADAAVPVSLCRRHAAVRLRLRILPVGFAPHGCGPHRGCGRMVYAALRLARRWLDRLAARIDQRQYSILDPHGQEPRHAALFWRAGHLGGGAATAEWPCRIGLGRA